MFKSILSAAVGAVALTAVALPTAASAEPFYPHGFAHHYGYGGFRPHRAFFGPRFGYGYGRPWFYPRVARVVVVRPAFGVYRPYAWHRPVFYGGYRPAFGFYHHRFFHRYWG